MSKFLKFFKYGIVTPTLLTYAGSYYYFEDLRDNQMQIFKAMQRYCRVGIAGLKMTYIYKQDEGNISEKHEKAALILRQAFLDNAGLFIKFGQLVASLDVIVPQEYRKHFELLCHDCPESSYENIKYNIEKHYQQPIDEIFEEFEKKPTKSASIGQVHKAKLKSNGETVAVKIMHDWLIEQSPSDLKMIETFIEVGEKIFPEFKFKWFGEECRYNLMKELDFKMEVENAEKCRKLLENHKNIRVPTNYLNLCNKKIIVMEWVDGIPIMDVEALRKSTFNLPGISKTISNAFCQMIFQDGFVHADPHQGNFIIKKIDKNKTPANKIDKNNDTEVILLDHGLYLNINEDTKVKYSKLWKGIITQDEKLIQEASSQLGAGSSFQLFVSMITSRKYDDVMNNEQQMKERLVSPDDVEHRKELANFGAEFHKQIIQLLHEMNRELLLLFKVNDFLRTIDNKLGTPINTFQITLDYCYKTLDSYDNKQHINKSILQKIIIKYQRMAMQLKLNLFKLFITLKIMNPI